MNSQEKPILAVSLRNIFLPSVLLILFSSCQYNSVSPASEMEPTFSNVGPLLEASCSGGNCHVGQRTSGVRLDSYENIVNSVGNQYETKIVQPGDAAGSPIIDKISGEPQFGSRMPFGRSPLSEAEIELISEWINNGAQND